MGLAGLLLLTLETHAAEIEDIRVWKSPERTRIVFDLSDSVQYELFALESPARIVIDIPDSEFSGPLPENRKLGDRVASIRSGRHGQSTRFVLDIKSSVRTEHFTLVPIENYGHRLVVDLYWSDGRPKTKQRPTTDEFIVVIDAGHGGEDPGAIGASRKTQEKNLVLDIAKQLKKKLDAVSGIRAELTRTGDYYIPLGKRTEIAANMGAGLFVSIHADAFTRPSAAGISVFALSQGNATSERARKLANKENAADFVAGVNLSRMEHDVAGTMSSLSVGGQIARSIDLGSMVRNRLSRVGKLHGQGVEQAGFAVLKTPHIPSILIEVGFISNPQEERRLKTKAYQTKIVKEIAAGIIQYAKKYPWGQEKWRTASSQ